MKADPERSPWGTKGRENAHKNISYHFCYEDGYFQNTSHKEVTQGSWHHFLSLQSGSLSSFTADKEVCLERFLAGSKSERVFKLDTGETKLKMKSIKVEERQEASIEPVTPSSPPTTRSAIDQARSPKLTGQGDRFLSKTVVINTHAARKTFGRLQVGVTWGRDCANCDLDLHVRPTRGTGILSYKLTSSNFGKFNKDWTSSPGAAQAYEYIDIKKPVEATELEIWLNFYSGNHPSGPVGSVRIWVEGEEGVFEQRFKIPAQRGRGGSVPRNNKNWIKINPFEVLGLEESRG